MTSATVQLVNSFETPLIFDTLPDAAALNQALAAAVRARCAIDVGVSKSNWSGWQSDTDMLEWGGEPASRLASHFLSLCDRFTGLPAAGPAPFLWSVQMWANLSGPGASNEAHVHPGVVWSAVYYAEDGYGESADSSLGGELILYDPRMPAVRMLPFDLRYRRPDGRVAQSQMPVRPIAGRIVMFPPWLYHSVRPYRGTGERISIAMNALAVAAPVRP